VERGGQSKGVGVTRRALSGLLLGKKGGSTGERINPEGEEIWVKRWLKLEGIVWGRSKRRIPKEGKGLGIFRGKRLCSKRGGEPEEKAESFPAASPETCFIQWKGGRGEEAWGPDLGKRGGCSQGKCTELDRVYITFWRIFPRKER